MKVSVQTQDFDAGAEIRALSRDPKVGAVAGKVAADLIRAALSVIEGRHHHDVPLWKRACDALGHTVTLE